MSDVNGNKWPTWPVFPYLMTMTDDAVAFNSDLTYLRGLLDELEELVDPDDVPDFNPERQPDIVIHRELVLEVGPDIYWRPADKAAELIAEWRAA